MRKIACLAGLVMVVALAAGTFAADDSQVGLGAKLWQVTDDPEGTMVGPTFSLDLPEQWWISMLGLFGKLEYEFGREFDEIDAEFVVGRSFDYVDVGAGFRYTTITVEGTFRDTDYDIYGPMAYVGTGMPFPGTPMGWYLGGSWMPVDLGDYEEGDHYNLEGGLFYSGDNVMVTVGYRSKSYSEGDDLRGPAVSAGIRF